MNRRSNRPISAIATLLAVVAIAFGTTAAQAQREPLPLSRELAMKLIADFYEVGVGEIKIAFLLEGSMKKGTFETKRAFEVTFIRSLVADGRRTRRVQTLKFLHDKELGWFLSENFDQNGRTYIDICSEHKGRIRIE